MSWLRNVNNFVKGVGGVLNAPIAMAVDVANAPFEAAGFKDAGEAAHDVGSAVGKAYDWVNSLPPVEATFNAMDTARSYAVSRPASTFELALSAAQSPEYNGVSDPNAKIHIGQSMSTLFQGKTWADAWGLSKTVSPGQSFYIVSKSTLPFAPNKWAIDPMDPDQLKQAQDDSAFHVISGIVDLGLMRFDPSMGVLSGVGKGRKALMIRKAKPGAAEQYLSSDPFKVTAEWTKGKTETELMQHDALRDNPKGPQIAQMIAEAHKMKNPDDALRKVFRVAHGDSHYLDALGQENARMADTLGTIFNPRDEFLARHLAAQGDNFPNLHTVDVDKVNRKLEMLAESEQGIAFNERLKAIHQGFQDNLPGGLNATTAKLQTAKADLRQSFRSERVFNGSPWGTTLRVVSWAPRQLSHSYAKGWINYNATDSWKDLEDELRVEGVSPELRQRLVDNYMRATSSGTRKIAKERAEQTAYAAILESKGVSKSAIQASLAHGITRRDRMLSQLKGERVYSAAEHNGMRADLFDDDGVWTALPVLRTHLADAEPVLDLKRIAQVADRHQSTLRALAAKPQDFATEGADFMNQLWKFNVLLRPGGYTTRLVLGDHFAIWAKLGVMADILNASKGTPNLLKTNIERAKIILSKNEDGALGVAAANRRQRLADYQSERPRIGQGSSDYTLPNGEVVKDVPKAFGGEYGQIFSDQVSADSGVNQLLDDAATKRLNHTMAQGKWDVLHANEAEEPFHLEAWADAVNRQTMKDPLAKMIATGKDPKGKLLEEGTDEGIWKWLTHTPEGIAYRKEMAWWSLDPIDMIGRVRAHVDQYIPEGPVRDYVKEHGRVSAQSLKKLVPNKDMRPDVHGQTTIEHSVPNGPWGLAYKTTTNKIMKGIGSLPTDVLSRHPIFSNLHDDKMRRLLEQHGAELGPGETISNEMIGHYSQHARQYALGETHKLLIDVARKSNAAHFLRFLMPFFGAWEQEMGRWMHIFYDSPEAARKAQLVWNAPNRLGLVVDQNGDKVPANKPLSDQDRIQIPIPHAAQKALGVLGHSDRAVIQKNSLNLALQGQPWWSPGTGPIVQIPVNELVKDHPEWARTRAAQFILPFGPSQHWTDLVKSTPERRWAAIQNENDLASRNMATMILQTEMTNYALGKRAKPPTMEEIRGKTNHLKYLRFFMSIVAPTQPRFESPYQPYIDQYHKMKTAEANAKAAGQQDVKSADETYYDKYGKDYFAFAQSVTKNNTGIPANIASVKASKKYKDLIALFPEFGNLIVGPEGGGQFDQAAYYYQLTQPLGPMSSKTYRESVPPDEVWRDNRAKLGWIQYMKFANQLEAMRIDQGVDKVSDSDQLVDMKRAYLEKMAKENPDWMKEYSTTDSNLAQERADAMEKIASDPRMLKNDERTEMRTILDYIKLRNQLLDELRNRKSYGGASSVDAKENADLLQTWESGRSALVERDPRFNDIFYRYLEHDMPRA